MGCIHSEGFTAVAMDHAAHPRNHGPLKDFNGHARITGPCGETMEIWLMAQHERVDRVSFVTDGCGSSIACGSMATALVEGKCIEDALDLRQQDILDALGGLPPGLEHCALLAAHTLAEACDDSMRRCVRRTET
jgi:nitrogen fixation NifU-like protein